MVGRKPRPTALKIISGNPGKRPLNDAEPTPDPKLPAPPAYLSAAAKREYWRLGKQLLAENVMTALDRNALALYCTAWARAAKAEEMLAGDNELDETPNGMRVQSPWLQIYNKAVEQMLKLEAEFGLTPSSRSRIKAGGAEKAEDPFAAFLEKGAQ